MAELLGLTEYLPYAKPAELLIGIALAVIAIGASVYVVKTSCGPLFVVLRWVIGYQPGQAPGDIAPGIGYGARIVFWAGLIGFAGWFLFH